MFGRFDVYFTLLLIKIKHILQENVQNERKEEIINFANKVCRMFLRAIILLDTEANTVNDCETKVEQFIVKPKIENMT